MRHKDGVIAQLVEQRTENPCVPGSIPGDTTENQVKSLKISDFSFYPFEFCPIYVRKIFIYFSAVRLSLVFGHVRRQPFYSFPRAWFHFFLVNGTGASFFPEASITAF